MALQSGTDHTIRSDHPIALEFGIITVILVGLYLWRQLINVTLSTLSGSPPAFGGILVSGLVNGGILLAGLLLLAGAYATFRDIEFGVAVPSATDLPVVGLAALAPVLLVALTKLVGIITGVAYTSLTKTSVTADPPVLPVLFIAGLSLLVGVPALVVICQVLIQGSFEQVVGTDGAIVLTTVVTGFVMVSNTGGLTTIPDLGKLIGTVLFTILLGVALVANERLDRTWLRYLGYVPLVAFAALIVLLGIAEIESVAGGLYAATQLTVLGVAAYAYARTESLPVAALPYASLLLANRIVVVVFEAGM